MKKGFTLIELLAVIVILAMIVLIATPIVLKIINNAKTSSTERSKEMYLGAVENSIASAILHDKNITDGTYVIMNNGNLCNGTIINNSCDGIQLTPDLTGLKPNNGTITIAKGKITDYSFTINNSTLIPVKSICSITNGDGTKIGDEITCGAETFYIYSMDDKSYKLLAKYNLYVGNTYNGSTSTLLSNPTGLQDTTGTAIGNHYKDGTTTYLYPNIATVAFGTSTNYENSMVKGYVDEYAVKLKKMGVNLEPTLDNHDASLLTKIELETLVNNGKSLSYGNLPTIYPWVYSSSYWMRDQYDSSMVWRIFMSTRYFYGRDYKINSEFGVRPVIKILKSEL